VLNSVVDISVMFAKYFEYYSIILRRAFFRGHAVVVVTGRLIGTRRSLSNGAISSDLE